MQFTPALVNRPPRGGNSAAAAKAGPQKQWVLADDDNGPVNYEKYAHAIAMPGPVLSSKTGKQYTPQLGDLGK